MALAPGTSLGHYQISALIGEGGMGQVWQATDTQLNRQVALKILPDAFAADPDRLARFQREAQVLASLNHPGIAAIHGIEEAEGTRALVLELIEGPTLEDRIKQGPIPVDEALPIAKQIAEALEAAHEAGVVHRDLKPANIKVREDGTVKVLDFGLAKALDTTPDGDPAQSPALTVAATQMGVIMGTAAYMSPEQARGKPVGTRADIWAFGVVLYEMVAGRPAFEGDTLSDTIAGVLDRTPDWDGLPANLPGGLATVLRRCLERDPRQRIQAIGDVRLAMDGAFESAEPPPPDEATRLRWWQRPLPALATGTVAIVATTLAAFGFDANDPQEVTRFAYDLPPSHPLRERNSAVLAVSPDGRRFIYNTAVGLFARSMDQFEPVMLGGTEDTLALPLFSPNGESVAYVQDGQLLRRSLTGGAPVALCPMPSLPWGASWERDNAIYFTVGDGIMRVSSDGGVPELVVAAGEGEIFDTARLLPSGDDLLFSVRTGTSTFEGESWNDAQIVAHSLETEERTVLFEGGSDVRYVPSGHLVFAFEDDLFAVAFDANRLEVFGNQASVAEGVMRGTGNSSTANYSVSSDGTLFYLTDARADGSLVWVDRNGRAETIETVPLNRYETPRLSPDGERVLVVADGDAWIYELASGRATRLTQDRRTRNYAGWTPSGERVTYSSDRGSVGELGIWMQSVDMGGEPTRLVALEGAVHFDSWAPDGRTFAAHHHPDGGTNQLMVSFDGVEAESTTWLNRTFADSDAVFSPDGRYVAYVSMQTGQREVHIRPFPGPGGSIPVSVDGGIEPVWAPNGEVFYRRLDDYAMMVVEVETDPELGVSPPQRLFGGSYFPGGSPRALYSVTNDGQRFLMREDLLEVGVMRRSPASGPQVHVVLNWLEELKRLVPVP